MTGIGYWIWWFVFCVLLVLVGGFVVSRRRSGERFALYVPLLIVLVVLVVFFPLAVLGVFH